MDFDDLDDAIDERLAAGDTEGLEGLAFEKKQLKEFGAGKFLPPIPTATGLYIPDVADSGKARIRTFIFYGAGETAEDYKVTCSGLVLKHPHLQMAVYEWPGKGMRAGESLADDVDALAVDALAQLNDAFSQVKEAADCEGAPFVFIGKSVGCQIMTILAKKVLMTFGMAPSAVIVADRAPLQFPLLSEEGKKVLESDPAKVVAAMAGTNSTFKFPDKSVTDMYAKDLAYACETKDAFFHKYECDVLLLKGAKEKGIDEKGTKSKYKMTQLQVKGKDEFFQMPVEAKTTVGELMGAVSSIFAYTRGTMLTAFDKDGKELPASSKVDDNSLVVDGLQDFKHPRYCWPHPVAVIGGGFYGVKQAMTYHLRQNKNVVLFDRHKQAGGDAWHLSATKYSRCQTDYGAFNIWYGFEFTHTGDQGFGTEKGGRQEFTKAFLGPGSPLSGTVASGAGTGVDYHPVRHQILEGMRYALQEYELTECSFFQSEVSTLEIIGDKDWEGRSYKLGVTSLKDPPEPHKEVKVSVVYHFPGAYDITRIVDYPGEDEFTKAGGQIGYGMGNGQGGEFIFDDGRMMGSRVAILGNGAFAVENVRSAVEEGASKVYIITRRKSLLCPRLPCWFCHAGPDPTPAGFLLDMFKPMYKCAGIEDPWEFYAVSKVGKQDALIKQASRFGIGDVTFLCHAYGLFEYRVDTCARMSAGAIHMDKTGEKLEVMHVCKALGLLGDPRVDKLHAMTHRLGNMVNGDWRRVMTSDATGMDAQRFTTFSAGPGAYMFVRMWHYIHTHPWVMKEAMASDTWAMLPKHERSPTQPDQPIYQVNVQYEMHCGNVFMNCFTGTDFGMGFFYDEGSYKYALLHTMHPFDTWFDYCKKDWDRYQDLIHDRNPGYKDVPRVDYPYNKDMVEGWFKRYNEQLGDQMSKNPMYGEGFTISSKGPSQARKNQCCDDYVAHDDSQKMLSIPKLIRETKYLHSLGDENPMDEALAGSLYKAKKDLTASKPDSAMDFDDEQYEAWKDVMATDYKFESQECDTYNAHVLKDVAAWGHILALIKSKA